MTLTVQIPAKFIAQIAFIRELKDTIRLFFRVYQMLTYDPVRRRARTTNYC